MGLLFKLHENAPDGHVAAQFHSLALSQSSNSPPSKPRTNGIQHQDRRSPQPATDASKRAELEEPRQTALPRYLFRAFSDRSRGLNNAEGIVSDACKFDTNVHQYVHQIPFGVAQERLRLHMIWKPCHPLTEFVSWSSSLLYALQLAVRKATECQSNICICVLDSSRLDTRPVSGVEIYPARALLAAYGIVHAEDMHPEYHDAEYLVYRGIKRTEWPSFSIAPFQDLLGAGLYRLLPELDYVEEKERLYRRVLKLRDPLFSQTRTITAEESRLSRTLGLIFGEEWVFPVAIALLSLRRREIRGDWSLQPVAHTLQPFRSVENEISNTNAFAEPAVDEQILLEVAQLWRLLREVSTVYARQCVERDRRSGVAVAGNTGLVRAYYLQYYAAENWHVG